MAWKHFYRCAADRQVILLHQDENIYYLLPVRAMSDGQPTAIVSFLVAAGVPRR